jgi:hypothetical protein
VAASGAAPRQHRTAILTLHSRAETVRLGALAIVRLKRSLGHGFVWLKRATPKSEGAPLQRSMYDIFSIATTMPRGYFQRDPRNCVFGP